MRGLGCLDCTAADAFAGIAGRLGVEIVRAAVDEDGTVDHLLGRESVGIDL